MTPRETAKELLAQMTRVPIAIKKYHDEVLRCEAETNSLMEFMARNGVTAELVQSLREVRQERRNFKDALSELELLEKMLKEEIHIQSRLENVIKDIEDKERYAKSERRSYTMRKLRTMANDVPNGR